MCKDVGLDNWKRRLGRPRSPIGFAFIGFLLLILGACKGTPEQQAQELVTKAREFARQGKKNAAIIQYRRAIQIDPRLAITHLELGKLYAQQEDYMNAVQQLNTAVEIDPSLRDARLELARILIMAKNYTDAKDQADAILNQNANDTDALAVEARASLGLGKNTAAKAAIDRALASRPDNADAWLVLAGLQYEAKDYEGSERSFRKSIAYDATQFAATAALYELLIKQNRVVEAEGVIRNFNDRNPSNLNGRYLLAGFLVQQKRLTEAEEAFRQISQTGASDPKQRSALATFYVLEQKLDLAEKELLRIVEKHPDDVSAQVALASLYMSTKRSAEGDRIAESVLKSTPDNADALVLHGRYLIEQSRIDEATVDLQHATRADSRSVEAHYFLALAQLQNKQPNEAQSELARALDLQPTFSPARILLAGIKLDSGQMKDGIADLDRAIADRPAIIGPYITRSLLDVQQGKAVDAEKNLLPLLNQFPQSADRALTYRALAWAMFNQKKYDAARNFLQQSEKATPDVPETLYLLGLTYIAENKPEIAMATVERRVASKPDWAEGYLAAGRLAALAGPKAQSETYLRKATSLDSKLVPAWETLGLILTAETKYDGAIDAFDKVLELSPDSASAYFNIAEVQNMRGDWAKAQESYRKSLELDSANPVAKNNLAWIYAEHGGNMDIALKLAEEAHQAKPDDPEICDTLGWIYLQKNTVSDAIQELRKSVSLVPSNPEYTYHLGVAYLRSGNKKKAKENLEESIHGGPNSPLAADARQMLASLKD